MWFLKLSAALVGVHQVQAFAKAASHIQRVSAKDALLQGSASRQLALFQKYAEDLVVSQLQNKQAPAAADSTEMIRIIDEFIEDMYDHSLFYHNQDKETGSRCQADYESCYADLWSTSKQEVLNIEKAGVEAAREAHKECRDVQAHACEKSDSALGFLEHDEIEDEHTCSTYTDYRKNSRQALLPNCAKLTAGITPKSPTTSTAALTDDFISADENTPDGASDLETMEACLREMKNWVDDGYPKKEVQPWEKQDWPGFPGLYPRYQTCSANQGCCADPAECMEPPVEQPGFCCTRQTQFQDAHCTYETLRQTDCHNVVNCRKNEVNKCKTDCDAVDLRVISRQADNETMERIKCLLGVITSKEAADKKEKLTECKSSLTDNTAFAENLKIKKQTWIIDGCPPTFDEHESDEHCHEPLPMQTCSEEFKQVEFGTWSSALMCSCSNFCYAAMQAAHDWQTAAAAAAAANPE